MPEPFPPLFGGTARTRILMSLLFDGNQSRRELARRLKVDPSFVLDRLRSLQRSGIVKRTTTSACWVFDWSFSASREVATVLERYAMLYAVVPNDAAPAGVISRGWEELFATPTRTAVLLAVARYKHRTLGELQSDTGFSRDSLRSAVDSLVCGGILAAQVIRHSRDLQLDTLQLAYHEVNHLLQVLNEYKGVD